MGIYVDMAFKSLNKYEEELCGDKVELIHTEDSSIMILADGMGSGIRANILAILTAKILGTLFVKRLELEEAVETVAKTLPVSKVNNVAYSTFSILQVFQNGNAYLVEYDNPRCIFLRGKKRQELPFKERLISGKKIRESHFMVQNGDALVLMSDGTIYCGTGDIMNYGWDRDSMGEYAEKCVKTTKSSSRMANLLIDACNDLYGQIPGDDTTVAVARIMEEKAVSILTGPPVSKDRDASFISAFMQEPGKKVICGGVTGKIAARELGKELITTVSCLDDEIPPTSKLEGVDLVTEGVVTLNRVVSLLRRYASDEVDAAFFEELDRDNGASSLARILIEECTTVRLFVGQSVNEAYHDKNMPFEITARKNVVQQLIEALQKMQIKVIVQYDS